MSSPSAVKLDLDARAAELKEKLLRSRNQSQARINTATPANNAARATATRVSGPGSGPSGTQFMPHAVPQQPSQNSVPADASDIAALIKSLSSTSPTRDTSPPGTVTNQKHSNETDIQATTSPKTSLQAFSTPSFTAGQTTSRRHDGSQQGGQKAKRVPPAKSGSYEEGEVRSSPEEQIANTRPVQVRATENNEAGRIASTQHNLKVTDAKRYDNNQSFANANMSSTQFDKREWAEPAAKQDEVTEKPVKLANGGGSMDNQTANADDGLPDDLRRALAAFPDVRDWLAITNYYDKESRTRKLERYRKVQALAAQKARIEAEERKLLEEEQLEMGFRQPAVVVPAPNVTASAATPSTPVTTTAFSPAVLKPAVEASETVNLIPAKRVYGQTEDERQENRVQARQGKIPRISERVERSDDGNAAGELRGENEPQDPRHRGSPPRRYSQSYPQPPSSPQHYEYRRGSPPPRGRDSRDYSPPRPAHHPPPGPRYRSEYDEPDGRYRKYDSYRGRDNEYRQRSPPRRREPLGDHYPSQDRLDLGRRGDVRFFIVKSFNLDNVQKCMEDGLWVTQKPNAPTLTSAFAKCKNVILFFSINKSRAFQGYARMVTAPSPDTPRPKWMNGINWDTSHPFRVEWISKVSVEFYRIGHLKNSYNENMPVLVGKDGQEIEEECGRALVYEMQSYADSLSSHRGGGDELRLDHGFRGGKFGKRGGKRGGGGGGRGPPPPHGSGVSGITSGENAIKREPDMD